ncbi:putative ankyrin-repeat protein [Maublancomyces gigas]|uniref:protein S-acyltransferase n=1 Tax=Discina gigas TaxID=1032678 RepID=A0ABR3GD53_9PEZI
MSLLDLPNELLLPIVESFEHPHDVNSLLLTNRRLAILLTPILNEFSLQAKHATTALFWAAANGCEPMVKLLLTHGAKIIVVAASSGKGAKMVLHQSPGSCSDMLVKFVMAQGVNLALQDSHGKNWIPLHWAAKNANLTMIKLLLNRGAEVDTRDHLGRTSLHLGSWFGPEVVRFLLENGADTSARDMNGYTPLHTAVRHSEEVMRILLEKGADVNAKDGNGSTPMHVAAKLSRGIVDLLLEHGASVAA